MEPENKAQGKQLRFSIVSPETKTIHTNDEEEVAKAVAQLQSKKARVIEVSDSNDKSIKTYTKGTFEKNYHAQVSYTK